MKISDPKIEASKSGQYNPSQEERTRLRAIREKAVRAGLKPNVRDNTPRQGKQKES